MPKDKQLFQVQNILETLVEATDHFSKLIKDKEINQSIYMFSSIVEGSQAITNMLLAEDQNFTDPMQKLEQYLLLISKELEQGRLMKVSEIVQFSLRPLFVRLQESFKEEIGDFKKDTISIGIFHSYANPKDMYPEDRLQATLYEGKKQQTNLYFFTSEDIDFENEQITADTYENDEWKRVTVPFPDVINNIGAGKRSQAERKLQRLIPFTGFHVGNKYTLPKKMVKHRKYAELLVPFTVCLSEKNVYTFMEKHNHVVFKALRSNRGENIFFVQKKSSRFVILDQKKERILSEEEFHQFLTRTILAEKGSFIVQRYIHTRTKDDEPYHFRAHVQKDHNGEWQITHIYTTIGNKISNLSNIATEARVENFAVFVRNHFGQEHGPTYEKDIIKLSLNVTKHLDKIYGMGLNELGLDFAIDETGEIWMHEANNGPQSTYHEEKRAINFIAYAKYIAENGLMRTVEYDGHFQARQSELPIADDTFETCIGMLTGKQTNDDLSITLAKTAHEKGIPFYVFTPTDVDYDLGLIRASFYEGGEWIQKIAEFPTAIIDRLKMRKRTEDIIIYEELEDIPFTNEWVIDAIDRSTMYDALQSSEELTRHVADYQVVRRPLHVFQWIEKYGLVQFKQEDLSHESASHIIKGLEDNRFAVIGGQSVKQYSENELRHFIQHRIDDHSFVVQELKEQPEHIQFIHSHMMKNRKNDWITISNRLQTVTIHEDDSVSTEEQSLETNQPNNRLDQQIQHLSMQAISALEKAVNKQLSEVDFTFALGEKDNLQLLDMNPNGPKVIKDNEAYAPAVIDYATTLGD